ncbi:MAG: SDR family oxidoreductase [Hyphomicrobiaceae bacterium]|nr:SDR family oxidoreductase [Hyphomicrobiaceae bacterium]
MSHLLCCGMGYSASALSRRVAARGWEISGTSRSLSGVDALTARGWRGALFDAGQGPSGMLKSALAEATHLLVSAAPGASGDPLLHHHAGDILDAPRLQWIGYLSTIGVYGDFKGAWIDETAATSTTSPRALARVAAETAWMDLAARRDTPLMVFRLAGIYGPGRSILDDILDGTARVVVKPGQVFNRIHVDDIAGALATAITKGRLPHVIYNGTDDEPAPPQEPMAFAAQLLAKPMPPLVPYDEATLSPMARSFYGDVKRVSNARLKADLGYTLQCPTYREGLTRIWDEMRHD